MSTTYADMFGLQCFCKSLRRLCQSNKNGKKQYLNKKEVEAYGRLFSFHLQPHGLQKEGACHAGAQARQAFRSWEEGGVKKLKTTHTNTLLSFCFCKLKKTPPYILLPPYFIIDVLSPYLFYLDCFQIMERMSGTRIHFLSLLEGIIVCREILL